MRYLFLLTFFIFFYASPSYALRNGEQALLRLPKSLTSTLAKHVERMHLNGYFLELNPKDFFHGHFIPQQWQDKTYSVAEILSDSPLILYHTSEYNSRWEIEAKNNIPYEMRTPRSIMGLTSGDIIPAIHYIDFNKLSSGRQNTYKNSGTLYDTDIVADMSGLESYDTKILDPHQLKHIQVEFSDGYRNVYVKNQFYILPDSSGPYQLPNHTRYDIFIAITNQINPIGYSNVKGYGIEIIPQKTSFPWPQQ